MFQFSWFAPFRVTARAAGLPHSEILGSIRVCRSPKLIAAYRVLRRRRVPRHPPHALPSFRRSNLKQLDALTSICSSQTQAISSRQNAFHMTVLSRAYGACAKLDVLRTPKR